MPRRAIIMAVLAGLAASGSIAVVHGAPKLDYEYFKSRIGSSHS